jgi:hypothetical protein
MVNFWDLTPCRLVDDTNILQEHTASIFRAKEGGSMFLQNVDTHLQVYMT